MTEAIGPQTLHVQHPLLQCRFCTSVPAVQAGYQAIQNVAVWFRITTVQGPFCRDCGTAVFRHLQQKTLTLGWYGILAPFAATVLLLNLIRMDKVTGLAAPGPAPGAEPRRSMDVGKPLFARPRAIIGVVVPAALLIALFILGLITSPSATPAG
ncbi:hypothetical protein AB0M46_26620 [Dactylosporangium sp. NPDC051485]|uniref:hypothetical protein n=1 Tax=Dactylosporangium sp. NPDC051485 TaxID=3154846 RepID=UPI0034333F17